MYRRLSFVSASLLICAAALAQTNVGAIVGTVTDASNSAVLNARITVTNMDTNIAVRTTTDDAGNFVVTPLLVGRYSVTAEANGFKTATQPDVKIDVQARVRTDFSLEVGAVTESIEVRAPNPLLQTDSSYVGQVMEAQRVNDLPLNGRYLTRLAVLAPGANPSTPGTPDAKTGNFSVNGLRSLQNTFLLDGIDNNCREAGLTSGKDYVVSLPPDAVGEFRLQTNNMSAEFGISAGGVMNVTTKAGTNKLHGDFYEFLRNDAFDAKNFFDSPVRSIPKYRLNQFGVTAGGPLVLPGIYKGQNRTFFFADFQGTRIRQGQTYVSTVPPAAWRTGDFSGFQPIYDPSTTTVTNGVATRQPFAGNRIPSDRFDPVAVKVMNTYPMPNLPGSVSSTGVANNLLYTPTQTDDIDQFDVRLDHRFSDRDSAFLRFSFQNEPEFKPPSLPGWGDTRFTQGVFDERQRQGVITQTHIFSPRTVNEFRAAYTWDIVVSQIPEFDQLGQTNVGAQLGIPGIPFAGVPWANGGTPAFSISGLTSIGSSVSLPTIGGSTEFQFVDILSMVRGAHTIKVGGEYKPRLLIQFLQPFIPRGRFTFNGDPTRDPNNLTKTGLGVADFLLGRETNSQLTNGVWDNSLQPGYAFFVQDDYKVTRKLTLNLGLRYQFDSHAMEKNNAMSSFNIATNTLDVVAGRNDPFPAYFDSKDIPVNRNAPRTLVPNQHLNFAPRVGFAYNIMPKTVIRGGYGIFWTSQEMGPLSSPNMGQNQPFYQNVTYPEASVVASNPYVNQLSQGFPLTTLTTGVPGQAQGLFSLDPHFRNPYAQLWNFGIQQSLFGGVVWDAQYTGSKGTALYEFRNINVAFATADPTISINSRRPYPFMGDDPSLWCSCSSSIYHALQTKLEKRWSSGLSFLASYSFGKTIDEASEASLGTGSGSRGFRDSNHYPGWERGLADFDVRHRFAFCYSYELPVGRGKRFGANMNRMADLLVGGWELVGIDMIQTGLPVTVKAATNPANTDGQSRPDVNLNGGPLIPANQGPSLWFNPAHFQVAVPGTYGNSGANILEGPGMSEVDFSVFKNIRLAERFRIEFRAEIFNILNHPNFLSNGITATFNGPGVGTLTVAAPSRQIQLALKLFF